MRSFSIEGGGGALSGEMGAFERAFPNAGGGVILGVTDVGGPTEVPVPTTVIVPGTSISKIPVNRFAGKSVRGNHLRREQKIPALSADVRQPYLFLGIVDAG